MTLSNDPITTISDEELIRWTDRAYREAVRCYQEVSANRNGSADLRILLGQAAYGADRYWHHLMTEINRRRTTAPAVIEGYANPDGSGNGNW